MNNLTIIFALFASVLAVYGYGIQNYGSRHDSFEGHFDGIDDGGYEVSEAGSFDGGEELTGGYQGNHGVAVSDGEEHSDGHSGHGSGGHGSGGHGSGGHGSGGGHSGGGSHGYAHHHPKYNYEYGVKDPKTKNHHSHWEHRDGDKVTGEYSLDEADGTKRIVSYSSDKKNGFTAHVQTIGHAKHDHGHGGHGGSGSGHGGGHGSGHGGGHGSHHEEISQYEGQEEGQELGGYEDHSVQY